MWHFHSNVWFSFHLKGVLWWSLFLFFFYFFSTWTGLNNFLQDSGPFCAPKYIHSRVFPLSLVYEGKGFLRWSSDDKFFFFFGKSKAVKKQTGILLLFCDFYSVFTETILYLYNSLKKMKWSEKKNNTILYS